MIHPLFRLLASRPELVAEHLAGYSQLVAVQAGEAAAQLRTRAWLGGFALIGAGVGIGLAGVAALFAAAVPLAQMPAPWALVAVPAAPLLLSLVCVLRLRNQPPAWSMELLRQQWRADAALLGEASGP